MCSLNNMIINDQAAIFDEQKVKSGPSSIIKKSVIHYENSKIKILH